MPLRSHAEEQAPCTQATVAAADGVTLLTRRWAARDPWAFLLLVHGLGEHSGRYAHVGARFAAAGIDTHAYDHRGNGGSGGRRGHVERWTQLHDDLKAEHASVGDVRAIRRPWRMTAI